LTNETRAYCESALEELTLPSDEEGDRQFAATLLPGDANWPPVLTA
jgi:hypothetical protein